MPPRRRGRSVPAGLFIKGSSCRRPAGTAQLRLCPPYDSIVIARASEQPSKHRTRQWARRGPHRLSGDYWVPRPRFREDMLSRGMTTSGRWLFAAASVGRAKLAPAKAGAKRARRLFIKGGSCRRPAGTAQLRLCPPCKATVRVGFAALSPPYELPSIKFCWPAV